MKKFLMIATLFFSTLVNANDSHCITPDQFIVTNNSLMFAYQKSMEICAEKGYQYFVFRNFKMTGPDGLTMELQGPQDLDADLIRETLGEVPNGFPTISGEFEIYCFQEKPELAVNPMDVEAFQLLVKCFQEAMEEENDEEENNVVEISTLDELNEHLNNTDLPVYVDFYSKSCAPCQMLTPHYNRFSIDQEGKGIFLKVNVAHAEALRSEYNVESIPLLLIFEEGKIADTVVGFPSILVALSSR